MLLAGSVSGRPHSKWWWCHDIGYPLLAAKHSLCKVLWSGTPCRTTFAHSRTMSPLDSAWKPGFSLATSVLSALETLWQLRYINTHLLYYRVCWWSLRHPVLTGLSVEHPCWLRRNHHHCSKLRPSCVCDVHCCVLCCQRFSACCTCGRWKFFTRRLCSCCEATMSVDILPSTSRSSKNVSHNNFRLISVKSNARPHRTQQAVMQDSNEKSDTARV